VERENLLSKKAKIFKSASLECLKSWGCGFFEMQKQKQAYNKTLPSESK